jgi:ABC-type transport system substrate-binding protein
MRNRSYDRVEHLSVVWRWGRGGNRHGFERVQDYVDAQACCGVVRHPVPGALGGLRRLPRAGRRGGTNTLRFNLQAEITDLDSTTAADAVSAGVLNNVMEGLYRLDEDEQPQPAMAKSVEISDDKLTYIFTLRDGVKWSNGDPVTAQDFEYAWLRAMDPETAGQISFLISKYIRGARSSPQARAWPRTWQ